MDNSFNWGRQAPPPLKFGPDVKDALFAIQNECWGIRNVNVCSMFSLTRITLPFFLTKHQQFTINETKWYQIIRIIPLIPYCQRAFTQTSLQGPSLTSVPKLIFQTGVQRCLLALNTAESVRGAGRLLAEDQRRLHTLTILVSNIPSAWVWVLRTLSSWIWRTGEEEMLFVTQRNRINSSNIPKWKVL